MTDEEKIKDAMVNLKDASKELLNAIDEISRAIHRQIDLIKDNISQQEHDQRRHVSEAKRNTPPDLGFMEMMIQQADREKEVERMRLEMEKRSKELTELYEKEQEKRRLRESWKKPKGKKRFSYFR